MQTRGMIATMWIAACATMACGDGHPCDPGQRYERGLCIAIEQDAAVPAVDAGFDASPVAERPVNRAPTGP